MQNASFKVNNASNQISLHSMSKITIHWHEKNFSTVLLRSNTFNFNSFFRHSTVLDQNVVRVLDVIPPLVETQSATSIRMILFKNFIISKGKLIIKFDDLEYYFDTKAAFNLSFKIRIRSMSK